MRHQNKGIFTHNNNLEWLLLAFETTRFGGGKTKNPSRHDPKSLLTVSLARLTNLSTTWTVTSHTAHTLR